ncbi:MAG: electron transfer flavoprotein subunit alpha/FixB family protein [Proteobacteria bacterium]|nr:electron transfer flavoprotein subunit alpha/FixB family protein [Pseudomonadota bacterium]
MKMLLVAEYRDGKLLANINELLGFAAEMSADIAVFLVGTNDLLPKFQGQLYLADVGKHLEYNPDSHKALLLQVVEKELPDFIVFSHSSYGWDLAPRLAFALGVSQISEVVAVAEGCFVIPACNAKLRRQVKSLSLRTVLTLQVGAFSAIDNPDTLPTVLPIDTDEVPHAHFQGYEAAAQGGVDLTKAGIIVSAGRGIGKPENVAIISALAKALGGEYGASRPVVDAQWVEHNRQVGTTGQSVAPKLYVACGISGAIQHLAGMKKSEFVVAVNTDRDAPISEIADVLVVADLKQFIPALTEKIRSL